MTADDDDESFEEGVAVPERLRQKLLKRLQGCQKILIEVEKAESKFSRFCQFKTGCKPGEWPPDDDAIVLRVAGEIHQHWLENTKEDESLQYRVWCTGYTKQGKRTRPSFQYLYSGPEGEDLADDDEEEGHDSERVQVTKALLSLAAQLGIRLDEAHVHIRELSSENNKMFEPMNNMVAYAGQMYVAAMEMQKNALYVIHDVKRQDREERAKDARLEKYAVLAGPALQQLAVGFSSWVGQKLSGLGKNGAAPAGPAAVPSVFGGNGVAPPWAASAATGDDEDGEQKEGAPAQRIDHPVASIARSLSHMLSPRQWSKINRRFTKKEFSLFASLLDAETDADVLAAWDTIGAGGISGEKLLGLLGDLDADQQAGYQTLQGAIHQKKAELQAGA